MQGHIQAIAEGRRYGRTHSVRTSLCDDSEARSMFKSSTKSGIFPTICARSEWKNIFRCRQSWPISFNGCTTPISLLTPITCKRLNCVKTM